MRRLAGIIAGVGGVLSVLAIAGCHTSDSILLTVTGDNPIQMFRVELEDNTHQHPTWDSDWNPVGKKDITHEGFKIALTVARSGSYTLLVVGAGSTDGSDPVTDTKQVAPTAMQLFWAGRVSVDGATDVSARLLTVPSGDDTDGDFWPDATDFPAHVPEAANTYRNHPDLLDCDDKTEVTVTLPTTQMSQQIAPGSINPFALEICGDGYDENCNGNADEVCIDKDHDGDYQGSDCDDNDAKRHHPTLMDPFPDPPNCCGYSLGKSGTPDENTDFLHAAGDPDCHTNCQRDAMLCPAVRCGDTIDESCQGVDTKCVVDEDCDGYSAADDCDDSNPTIHPGAPEICNDGIKQNCNNQAADEGCVPCDLDGDGWERMEPASGCPDKNDTKSGEIDCDDNDSGVHPHLLDKYGGQESGGSGLNRSSAARFGGCRLIYEPTGTTGTAKLAPAQDLDCNGIPLQGCPTKECDKDGDGFPGSYAGCADPEGKVDCDDTDPTIFPGAPPRCNMNVTCTTVKTCGSDDPDADGDSYPSSVDCDDGDPNVHPFAIELCNGKDDDCDGSIDDGNPDLTGAAMVKNGAVTVCTDSNVGECGKQSGRCVCSKSRDAYPTTAIAGAKMCPGEDKTNTGSAPLPRCNAAGQPQPQSCDERAPKDDDCDGKNDAPDGVTPFGLKDKGKPCGNPKPSGDLDPFFPCTIGVMAGCDLSAQSSCMPAGERAWVCHDGSVPYVACKAELCNGIDDNCDGTIGEDKDGDGYLGCSGCDMPFAKNIIGCNDCDDDPTDSRATSVQACTGGDICKNKVCAHPLGGTCLIGAECNSGFCADGFCCNSACGSECQTCKATPGQCTPVAAMSNANHGLGCSGFGSGTCGGYCDGTNSTCFYPNSNCRAASCSVLTYTPPANCSLGLCPLAVSQICLNACSNGGCVNCTNDASCPTGYYCSKTASGHCTPQASLGGSCAASLCKSSPCNICGAGAPCVDNVCCQSSCSTPCFQCQTGTGSCNALSSGTDPECSTANPGYLCSTNGCAKPNSVACAASSECASNNCVDTFCCNTVCNTTTCSGSTLTSPTCSATPGTCTSTNSSCAAPYVCSGNSCASSCSCATAPCSSAKCASGYFCDGSSCMMQLASMASCSASVQCQSGTCTSGMCN